MMDCKDVAESPVEQNFRPLVIVEFDADVNPAAVEWLIAKTEADKIDGGAGLQVKVISNEQKKTMLFVGASLQRLLLGAEMMDMQKMQINGQYSNFSMSKVENFQGSGNMESFFTVAEMQKIVFHELQTIRASQDDTHIPGYENIKLYQGKCLLGKYQSGGIITQVYPLHDADALKELGDKWFHTVFSVQPLDKIRAYFGEKIALYFAFLGVYTFALLPPALIGVIYFFVSFTNIYQSTIFALFNLIWTTVFLESWKIYCSELTHRWGTINAVKQFEEPRVEFRGRLGKNPVTGREEPVYPKWKKRLQFYCISVPVIAACLVLAFQSMLGYFWLQKWANEKYAEEKALANYLLIYVPTIIYAVIIGIMNALYRIIVKKLNDWENHRLQSSYDNHLITKLVLFDFVNCFVSLFYVAFYLQDMDLLKRHLAALLITQQVIGQIKEAVLPFYYFRYRTRQMDAFSAKYPISGSEPASADTVSQEIQKQANIESIMDVYQDPLDDYLEMFLQFGYVFLFSSVFPLAALWALINNVTEIRSDAFKMCRVFQRPCSVSASNIGAWQIMFEFMGAIAVMTNCALIGLNPEVCKLLPLANTPAQLILVFVAMEHIVFGIKLLISYMIPDVPKWIQTELAITEYQAKQALQKKRLTSAQSAKLC